MASATFQIAMTPAQLDALATKYMGAGATYTDAGILPKTRGVQLGYSVNRSTGDSVVVTFTVIQKPIFASVGMIQNELKKMISLA